MSVHCALRAQYRHGAEFLLWCRSFDTDTLLIAADALREIAREYRLSDACRAADEAAALADQLATEAPKRLERPRWATLSLLDRAILIQAHTVALGERLTTAEVILRAAEFDQTQRAFHVSGGAR